MNIGRDVRSRKRGMRKTVGEEERGRGRMRERKNERCRTGADSWPFENGLNGTAPK